MSNGLDPFDYINPKTITMPTVYPRINVQFLKAVDMGQNMAYGAQYENATIEDDGINLRVQTSEREITFNRNNIAWYSIDRVIPDEA